MNEIFPEELEIGPTIDSPLEESGPPKPSILDRLSSTRPNPWQLDVPEKVGRLKGLSLWLFAAVNGMLLCIFSILFTHKCLVFLWQFCLDTLFARRW